MGFALLRGSIITANTGEGGFSFLDRKTLKERLNLSGQAFSGPHGLAVCRNRQLLYAADSYEGRVCAIDCLRGRISAAASVGATPCHLVLSGSGGNLYVTNYDSDSVSVLHGSTLQPLFQIPVGRMPHDICFSGERGLVFVAESGQNSIGVIDAAQNRKIGSIPLSGSVLHMKKDRQERFLYGAGCRTDRFGEGRIVVVDMKSCKEIKSFRLGSYLTDLCLGEEENTIYVCDGGFGCVYGIDAEKGEIRLRLETGMFPCSVAWEGEEGALTVGDHMSGRLTRYDLKTGRVICQSREFRDLHHFLLCRPLGKHKDPENEIKKKTNKRPPLQP